MNKIIAAIAGQLVIALVCAAIHAQALNWNQDPYLQLPGRILERIEFLGQKIESVSKGIATQAKAADQTFGFKADIKTKFGALTVRLEQTIRQLPKEAEVSDTWQDYATENGPSEVSGRICKTVYSFNNVGHGALKVFHDDSLIGGTKIDLNPAVVYTYNTVYKGDCRQQKLNLKEPIKISLESKLPMVTLDSPKTKFHGKRLRFFIATADANQPGPGYDAKITFNSTNRSYVLETLKPKTKEFILYWYLLNEGENFHEFAIASGETKLVKD